MHKSPDEMASRYLPGREPTETEERIIESALHRQAVSRDLSRPDPNDGFGERLADGIARVGGSWSFIIGFLAFLVFWTLANAWLLGRDSFDPYPFIFLNLVLSMIAAIQAPIIMMSQNRQAARDRRDAAHDYEVNLKAEIEIMGLHEKMDALRHREIVEMHADLRQMREQIAVLERRLSGQ